MTPNDDDQDASLWSQVETGGIATTAAAALAAISAGIAVRVNELIALADQHGRITIPVRSTCFRSLSYNLATRTMGLLFHDGSTYDHPSVPIYDFLQFVNAPSKGSHYNSHFRGQAVTQFAGSKKQRIKLGR